MSDDHLTVDAVEAIQAALGEPSPTAAWQRLVEAKGAYDERQVAVADELAVLRETYFEVVRELVEVHGVPQAEVGRRLGLTRQRIYEILGGEGPSLGRPWRRGQ